MKLSTPNTIAVAALAAQEVADMELLRHTLGARSTDPARDRGYRNYFNAGPGHGDMPGIERLVARGLMIQNPRNADYWHATEAGCKVAGLNVKQTGRALHRA